MPLELPISLYHTGLGNKLVPLGLGRVIHPMHPFPVVVLGEQLHGGLKAVHI